MMELPAPETFFSLGLPRKDMTGDLLRIFPAWPSAGLMQALGKLLTTV